MTLYYRPLVQHGHARPDGAVSLAGTSLWFDRVEVLSRNAPAQVISAQDVPQDWLKRLCTPRDDIAGLNMSVPQIMGILNTTPDSFSDGGRHNSIETACNAAREMCQAGASILDIGGESTRPGAAFVPAAEEVERTAPIIATIRAESTVAISVDTRKAPVAEAALEAGASLVNDVSGFTFDPELAPLCAKADVPVCVMHAQGDPATMQDDPVYENVLLDVYDFLEQQLQMLEGQGIPRARVLVDPGIGFGKTLEHNLTLLQNLSLFHGLGAPILLGVSRKGFIGKLGQEPQADHRAPGSIAVGLAGLAQGVQVLRVHDVTETTQALRLWQAVR